MKYIAEKEVLLYCNSLLEVYIVDMCNSVDIPHGGSYNTSAGVSAKHKRICKDSWQVVKAVRTGCSWGTTV